MLLGIVLLTHLLVMASAIDQGSSGPLVGRGSASFAPLSHAQAQQDRHSYVSHSSQRYNIQLTIFSFACMPSHFYRPSWHLHWFPLSLSPLAPTPTHSIPPLPLLPTRTVPPPRRPLVYLCRPTSAPSSPVALSRSSSSKSRAFSLSRKRLATATPTVLTPLPLRPSPSLAPLRPLRARMQASPQTCRSRSTRTPPPGGPDALPCHRYVLLLTATK